MRLNYPYFWQKKRSVISWLLLPFSSIYLFLTKLRYDNARLERIGKFVICIGNSTVGGTGKTQLIKKIAGYLQDRNKSFVIVTKGYGSKLKHAVQVHGNHKPIEVGDESLELLSSGPVIAAKKPGYAARLIEQMGADIVLVDDGLQNPNFIKDLSILTIDPQRAIGNGRIIPAGPLREYIKDSLAKVSAIVIAGNEPVSDFGLIQKISHSKLPFYKARIVPVRKSAPPPKGKFIAFCGIGNPDKFFSMLAGIGYEIAEQVVFSDHHHYSIADLDYLYDLTDQYDAKLVTTRKDYVKIPYDEEIEVVDVTLDFGDDDTVFNKFLDKKIG